MMGSEDNLEGLRVRLRELASLPKPYSETSNCDFLIRLEDAWVSMAKRVSTERASHLTVDDLNQQSPWRGIERSLSEDEDALAELQSEAENPEVLADMKEELVRKRDFVALAREYSRGAESQYFGEGNDWLIDDATEQELRRDISRIEEWIEECRDRFDAIWMPWLSLHFLTDDEYSKHFPEKGWDTKTTRAMSKVMNKDGKAVSCFYPGITRERLMEHFWYFLDECWDSIISQHHVRLYEDALTIIGASHGEDTSVILWDIHVSNKVVHGFPVRPADIPEGTKIYRCIDDLSGYSSYYEE